jgi:superfamily II DNA/RNA helicase
LLKGAARAGLERPTAVQALTVPAALCGCDVLAVAETGSGKTLAFGWPLLAHVAAQEASPGCAPVALVVVPTRELCEQVYRELTRHAKYAPRTVGTVAVFGGAGKWEMARELKKAGSDVVVATPGRMMEFIQEQVVDLQERCTFLVVDEADRMFELGFQDQLTSLAQRIRPSRQAIFTTATLPPKVDGLVRSALCKERLARVVVGAYASSSSPAATENVLQKTHVLPSRDARLQWLLYALPSLIQKGRVVVFCGRRTECEVVTGALRQRRIAPWTACLHGDVDGARRSSVLTDFRNARGGVLVATDVAARGVDVKGVACVVNYDVPSSMAQYVHRVGRTARAVAGDADVSYGEAHTLLCRGSRDDEAFSKQLVNSLRGSTRSPPDADLYKFAKMKPIVVGGASVAPAAFSRPQSAAPVPFRNPLFAPPPATTAFAPPPTYAAPPPPPPPAHADADRAAAVEAARRIAARLAGGGYK